ncbi:MAG: hypothetical protein R3281_11375 [Balneolaceae bacterium]|nr:hypothetical protein [Balneolaceae bacterium]
MKDYLKSNPLIPGLFFVLGMAVLGFFVMQTAITFKSFERTVTVKVLAEQEHPANIVIWPIQFTEAGNNLEALYT